MRARVRIATLRDAAEVADIYAPVVRSTAISFELEPPSAEAMAERMRATLPSHPWLVLERDGSIDGYAYAGELRTRPAYRWSAETTVYVRAERRRAGVARALYGALLAALELSGFAAAYAGITLPNPASVGLHERLGFRCVGVFPAVGYKLGAWHDVGFWQREIGLRSARPAPPRRFADLVDSAEMKAAIAAFAC